MLSNQWPVFILSFALAFSFVACSGDDSPTDSGQKDDDDVVTDDDDNDDTTDDDDDDDNDVDDDDIGDDDDVVDDDDDDNDVDDDDIGDDDDVVDDDDETVESDCFPDEFEPMCEDNSIVTCECKKSGENQVVCNIVKTDCGDDKCVEPSAEQGGGEPQCLPEGSVSDCDPDTFDDRCENNKIVICECKLGEGMTEICEVVEFDCGNDECKMGGFEGEPKEPHCMQKGSIECDESEYPKCIDNAVVYCRIGWEDRQSPCPDGQVCVASDVSGQLMASCVDEGLEQCDSPGTYLDCADDSNRRMCTYVGMVVTESCPPGKSLCIEDGYGVGRCVPEDTELCDPQSYEQSCEDDVISSCTNIGSYSAVIKQDCSEYGQICRANNKGEFFCVPPDSQPCEYGAYQSTCENNIISRCTSSSYIEFIDCGNEGLTCRKNNSGKYQCTTEEAELCETYEFESYCLDESSYISCETDPESYSSGFTATVNCEEDESCLVTCMGMECGPGEMPDGVGCVSM